MNQCKQKGCNSYALNNPTEFCDLHAAVREKDKVIFSLAHDLILASKRIDDWSEGIDNGEDFKDIANKVLEDLNDG